MRRIREILRLKWDRGLSNRAVARACAVGTGTVSECARRARAAELSWPLPPGLDDAALEHRLYPPPQDPKLARAEPDFAAMHQDLRRGRGVTRQLLWLEYRAAHPDGYRYSQFCKLYRRWAGTLDVSMRQHHRAGERVFVDFSGVRPEIVDRRSGEVVAVELFVGVLGASSYIYAEATADQSLLSWTEAHVRMLAFFGGSPQIYTPDNLKSGITTPCRYEPQINRTYAELAHHYGAVVIPARSGRPKDKAKAENGVQQAQRWILAPLRNESFFALGELNTAIAQQLCALNERPMKGLGLSRRQLFERLDRPALLPLPATRYEMAEWRRCRVNIDYHVELHHNLYSVPYQLVGEELEARLSPSTVEMFFKSKRVASHQRLFGRGQVSTLPEHMPSSHRAHAEWTPSRLIRWAQSNGPSTGQLIAEILKSRPHPEQGFRSCLGIMRLGKRYGSQRLEAACERAQRLGAPSYRTVQNILASGFDRRPLEEEPSSPAAPRHNNIRGAHYYGKENQC